VFPEDLDRWLNFKASRGSQLWRCARASRFRSARRDACCEFAPYEVVALPRRGRFPILVVAARGLLRLFDSRVYVNWAETIKTTCTLTKSVRFYCCSEVSRRADGAIVDPGPKLLGVGLEAVCGAHRRPSRSSPITSRLRLHRPGARPENQAIRYFSHETLHLRTREPKKSCIYGGLCRGCRMRK
jgi:hypothetical protein